VLLLAIALTIDKVPEPKVTVPPAAPPPARERIVLLKLFKFKVVEEPLPNVTALLGESVFAAPACNSVPALIVVAPEYKTLPVLFNCRMPLAVVVKLPVPVIEPPNCVVLAATRN